ncbi:MAG: pentapeptide repeat-containing protein [Gammaproteobacteria bacterium]|nr:pentapeptide repeat-containing protein [Gammaproteobacteria bacterium]
MRPRTTSARGPLLVTAGVLGVVLILAVLQAMPPPRQPHDCAAGGGRAVNWDFCNKAGQRFEHLDLARASARNARLTGAFFGVADLRFADLSYADLADADLSLADLRGARLVGASLRRANLAHAGLGGADLRFADLRGARLDGADLSRAHLGGAIWSDGRTCPRGARGRCFSR